MEKYFFLLPLSWFVCYNVRSALAKKQQYFYQMLQQDIQLIDMLFMFLYDSIKRLICTSTVIVFPVITRYVDEWVSLQSQVQLHFPLQRGNIFSGCLAQVAKDGRHLVFFSVLSKWWIEKGKLSILSLVKLKIASMAIHDFPECA